MFDIKFKTCDLIPKNLCKVKYSKTGYSERAYKILTLSAKCFSFPMALLHVVNLTDVMNYAYNEVNSPIPGTSL